MKKACCVHRIKGEIVFVFFVEFVPNIKKILRLKIKFLLAWKLIQSSFVIEEKNYAFSIPLGEHKKQKIAYMILHKIIRLLQICSTTQVNAN